MIAQYDPRAYATPVDPDERYMVRTDYNPAGRPFQQWVPRYDNSTVSDLSADPAQSAECPAIDIALYPKHKPAGNPAYPNGIGVCLSQAQYDAGGRVTTVVLPTAGWNRSASADSTPANPNRHLNYTYTGDNLIATESSPSPTGSGQATTVYTYNGAGQPERVDRPLSRTERTVYSLDGLVLTTTGAPGEVAHVQTFGYDQAGNKTSATRTVNGVAETDTWTYTADNLVSSYVDGANGKTSYEYDLVGNPVRVYSASANACAANNCPIGATRGTPTRYAYTLDNLVAATTVPVAPDASSRRQTTYAYDLGGRKTDQAVRMVDGTDISPASASNASPTTVSANSLTLQKPTGTQVGDVMLAAIVVNDMSPAPTAPSGWIEVRNDVISGALRQVIYRKTVTSPSEPSSYNWGLSSFRRITGGIQTFRGVDTANPVVDHNATIITTAGSPISSPPLTGMRGGLLVNFAAANAEGTITPPAGMDKSWLTNAYSTDTRDIVSAASAAVLAADGPTVAPAATTTALGGHIGADVVLRPANPTTPTAPSGITLIGQSTPATTGDASSKTLAISRPAGLVVDDLLVAQLVSNDDDPPFTAPTGWTELSTGTATVTDALRQTIFVKKATAADVAASSFTFSLTDFRRITGAILAYRGVDTTSLTTIPVASVAGTTSGTSITTGTVTAAANAELLQFSAVNSEGSIAPPTGMTELLHGAAPNSSNTRDIISGAYHATFGTSSGSTGPWAATANPAGKRIGTLVALPPAAVGGPPTDGSTSQKFSYYPDDRLKEETGRNNEVIHHRYDAAGNPIETKDVGANTAVTGDYYLDGLPRTVTSTAGTTSDSAAYGYNGVGLTIARTETGTQTQTSRYGYNDSALLSSMSSNLAPDTWTWTYDQAGRTSNEVTGNQTTHRTWHGDDTLDAQQLIVSGTVVDTWTYHQDELYRQTQQVFSGKDAAGSALSSTLGYHYDHAGRVDQFTTGVGGGATTKTINWDPDGNRTAYAGDTASYNADDSIHSATPSGGSPTTFSYLPFGGLQRDDQRCNTYDGFDRLTAVTTPGTGGCQSPTSTNATYLYDALDRQRSTTITAPTSTTTSFVYDGWAGTVAGEKAGTALTSYLVDPNGDKQAVKNGTTIEQLIDDGYGNLAAATTSGAITCTVAYNPFGEGINPQTGTVLTSGNVPCNSGSTKSTSFYRGERRDQTTGQYQLGSRTYDPKKASFLTPDSYRAGSSNANLSVSVDPLSRNSYGYVNGDPINYIDPDGHLRRQYCADQGDGVQYCPTPSGGLHRDGDHARPRYTATGNPDLQRAMALDHLLALRRQVATSEAGCAAEDATCRLEKQMAGSGYADNPCLAAMRDQAYAKALDDKKKQVQGTLLTAGSCPNGALFGLAAGFFLAPGAAMEGVPFLDGRLSAAMAPSALNDLVGAVDRAAAASGPGSGAVYGTRVHSAFAAEIGALGRSDIFSEVSYLNGRVVPYGTRGSVRLDVVVGHPSAPSAIYDLKTGTAMLSPSRIAQIRAHLPPGFQNIPVLELRPK